MCCGSINALGTNKGFPTMYLLHMAPVSFVIVPIYRSYKVL